MSPAICFCRGAHHRSGAVLLRLYLRGFHRGDAHCLCNHIPSIRKYFEMGDLAGRIAPRKPVIAAGREDAIFPLPGTERVFSQIARIYADAGVPQNCALVIGDGGHLNYADLLWEKLHKMGV